MRLKKKILHEDPADYKTEIRNLMEEGNEEEIYLRGSLFKREIPKIYNNTCCISGMRINAAVLVSMIDACHIIPFSESYNDTITNGIALCPNLHRAFDRGLIAIDKDYKVIISDQFNESENDYGIRKWKGKRIALPQQNRYWPDRNNFLWHYNKVLKK